MMPLISLVVLDDASTDDVAGALATVTDRRLRLERNARSAGLGPAHQRLLDLTDNRFVATMDADDVSLPGRFRRQLGELQRGADYVFTPVLNVWEGSRWVRPGLTALLEARSRELDRLQRLVLSRTTRLLDMRLLKVDHA